MSEPSRTEGSVCPGCGGTVAPGVPFGMCSRCLVESALGGADDASDLLEDDGSLIVEEGEEGGGGVIGPYRLVARIGEGAFGEVFAALQQHPVRRKVALKLLKRGMDSRQITARFEVERQALALMKHPNVATVFDGGESPDGRPFFVLELVDGPPITEFCAQGDVGLRERLELFRAVCEGVHHAHLKGIIHRDLKPQNVLVDRRDGRVTPKVIDFGIAKVTEQVVTARTILTETGRAVGTPAYMSPEQATGAGADVDVRSDVYSLGALLYHLVAGRPPFDEQRLRAAGPAGLERILLEEEPRPPTAAGGGRGGRSDLDWIVLKALAKDRDDRYDSAAALGEDVGRYLRGEAVTARPPSAAYRLRKFARRHRVGLAATAAVFLVLVAGVVVSLLQWRRALRAEAAAAERAVISEALYDAINDDFVGAALEHGPMIAFRLGTILDQFEARIDASLADHPLVEAGSRLMLSRAFHGLDRVEAAERNARRSLELYREHVGETDRRELGAAAILARALESRGASREALEVAGEALARGAGIPRGTGADLPIAALLEVQADAMDTLGGDPREVLAARRRLVDYRLGDRDAWRRLMEGEAALAESALAAGEVGEAAHHCRRATILASFINRGGMWLETSRLSMLNLRRRILAANPPPGVLVDSFNRDAAGWEVDEVVGELELPESARLLVTAYVRSRRDESGLAADLWTRCTDGLSGPIPHAVLHGEALRLEASGRHGDAAAAAWEAIAGVRGDIRAGTAEALYWYAATWNRTRSAAGLPLDPSVLPLSAELVFADNGHRYRRIEVPLPWEEARAVCEQLGGHLATIGSEEENRFVHDSFARDRICWLGGSDAESEGDWRWVVPGESWSFAPWAARQPSGDRDDEDYAAFGSFAIESLGANLRFGAKWFDSPGDGIATESYRHDPFRTLLVTHAVCEWDE